MSSLSGRAAARLAIVFLLAEYQAKPTLSNRAFRQEQVALACALAHSGLYGPPSASHPVFRASLPAETGAWQAREVSARSARASSRGRNDQRTETRPPNRPHAAPSSLASTSSRCYYETVL